ncbi:hypothetical protein BH10PSE2_BH10PSE2_21210 [soil metagenome]
MLRPAPAGTVLLILPLLGGCVIYDSEGRDDVTVRIGDRSTVASSAPLESLRGVRFEPAAGTAPGVVVVRVDSAGCTSAADFEVAVSDGSPVDLTLTRKTPDQCEALLRDGVELRWTYADLGLKPGDAISIRNPVRLP